MVGHVGRTIAQKDLERPLELLVDGDLLSLVKMLVWLEVLVLLLSPSLRVMRMRAWFGVAKLETDEFGNDMAGEAADLGRHRVDADVIAARNSFAGACRDWYPVTRDFHRFFIAISRAIVNDDGKGGTAPDPLCWCSGAKGKRRRVIEAVRAWTCRGVDYMRCCLLGCRCSSPRAAVSAAADGKLTLCAPMHNLTRVSTGAARPLGSAPSSGTGRKRSWTLRIASTTQ